MTYQGEATRYENGYIVGSLSDSVKTGDLVVTTFMVSNYLLREGQTSFDPADVLLPAGWVLVDAAVVRAGGDPRRIARIRAVAASVMTASSPRVGLRATSVVPYYAADQDPGSWGPASVFSARYWRGEKGVADVSVTRQPLPVHVGVLDTGRSRDGGGSVWRQLVDPLGEGGIDDYGSWMSSDDPTIVNRVPYPYSSGDVASEGSTGQRYAWRSLWNGKESSPYFRSEKPYDSVAVTVTIPSYPLAPVITSPAGGALLDLERDGVSVSWLHRPSLAGPQAGWALRHTLGSDVKYWNAAGKVWSSTLVKNPGTLSSVDLSASAFPGGTGLEHRFEVATYGANLDLSMWSSTVAITGVLKPSASVSFVGVDLSGSLASLRPQVIIGGVSPAGLALTAWSASLVDVTNGREVATGSGVFDASGQVTWAPNVEVDNGVTVQAVVRVQQAGGAWSAPESAQAVTDVDVPGVPVLVVAASEHEFSGAPSAQVRVDFPWETDGYAWASRATLLRLERLDRGEWVTVAEIMLPPGRASAVLDDYAVSAGELAYRARGEGQAVDGSRLIGAWGYSTSTTIDVPGGWLIDPAAPERSTRVNLAADESRKLDLRTVTMEALGRDEVLTAAGTPLLESGSTTVRVDNAEHRARVLTLLTSGAVLKLTFCPERDVFAGGARQDAESLWFRPVGDVDTSRVVSRGPWALRHVSWSWVSQRPPVLRRAEAG